MPLQTQVQAQLDPPYEDDPGIRECFADQIRVISVSDQTVKIEFVVARMVATKSTQALLTLRPSARLVLSMRAAAQLREQLVSMLDSLQQGVLNPVVAMPGTKQ